MRRRRSSSWIKTAFATIVGIIGVALTGIVLAVAGYVVAGLVGFVAGHIIRFFFGEWVSLGLNTIFNTTRFTADLIPYITTALVLMVNFIKPVVNLNVRTDGD